MWRPTNNNSCLGNIDRCDDLGMALMFRVRIDAYHESMVLFSSCAEQTELSGIQVFYRYGLLQYMVATQSEIWFTSSSRVVVGTWHEFAVSWSVSSGLQVYMDGTLAASSISSSSSRTLVTSSVLGHMDIGKSVIDVSVKTEIWITVERVTFYYARYDLLVASGKLLPSKYKCYLFLGMF